MNHTRLSKRLAQVASYVNKGARLADIGSDHAYLPCYLMLQQHIAYAVAGEVVQGPYQSAKEQVAKLALEENIAVRLANGLDAIQAEDVIDTVTICGMGGDLIASILEQGYQKGKLATVDTLILQPNVGERFVRSWLAEHQYRIVDEAIVQENNKCYEIIVAKQSDELVTYSEHALTYGVYLPARKEPAFVQKWQSEYEKYDKIMQKLRLSTKDETDKYHLFKAKQKEIAEVIGCQK